MAQQTKGRAPASPAAANGSTGPDARYTLDKATEPDRLRELDAAEESRFARAQAEWGDADRLTPVLLRKLQPLLNEPLHPRYIEHMPSVTGKPYESTGIRSVQVQVDRLAEVLGVDHFRVLAHHQPGGQIARVHVVIGNELQWCRLDERGELVPFTVAADRVLEADVLAHADGWGGHGRGSAPGDVWKGSETNAAKRVIARVGPGAHVYRLDFEDDPTQPPAATPPAAPAAPAPDASPMATLDAQQELDAWLATTDDMRELRESVVNGLRYFTEDPVKIMMRVRGKDTREKLEALLAQAAAAVTADQARGEEPQA